jgi:hypothetical protein
MNRQEKQELVSRLYKEGKTMREIAKEVHMSFSDIGYITKKPNGNLEPKRKEISKESEALKLFSEGKSPVDVAISLDVSASKAAGIYKQFWKLRGLYKLHCLYEQVKPDISLLGKVHDVVKKYNLEKKDIINIVRYAPKHLYLIDEIENLEWQLDSILNEKDDANDSLLSAKIKQEELIEQIDKYNDISIRKNSYLENLDGEIEKIENQISKLKNSDEYYTKFEQFAKEKLDSNMKDIRWILPLAIDAVIQSIKKDPFKQMIINDEIADKVNQNKLLDSCELLFDKLLKQFMDITLEFDPDQNIHAIDTPNLN